MKKSILGSKLNLILP